jgi:hypothetical protein
MLRNGVMVRLLWGLLLRFLFRASKSVPVRRDHFSHCAPALCCHSRESGAPIPQRLGLPGSSAFAGNDTAGFSSKTKIRCDTDLLLLVTAFTEAAKMETEGCQRSGRVEGSTVLQLYGNVIQHTR